MTRLDLVIVCGLIFLAYIHWYIHEVIRSGERNLKLDVPLREVIAVTVQLKDEFFTEALMLSCDEVAAAPQLVRSAFIRIEIWKGHYSGTISFRDGNGALLRENYILELPTTNWEFPVSLSSCPLLKNYEEGSVVFDIGANSPEKLEALISHKALMLRAKDGRFSSKHSGASFKADPSDIVIPIREGDLEPYVDDYGSDDPDWLMGTGSSRRYKRRGRWAYWTITAVCPVALDWTMRLLDATPAQLND